MEVVAQIEINRAYRIALSVFARALQAESKDNVFDLVLIGHCVDIDNASVVNFDCDIAVGRYIRNIEQTCLGEDSVVCKLICVFVRDIDFDVCVVNENVALSSVCEVGDFVQSDSAGDVLFEINVARILLVARQITLFVGKESVFRAVEFVNFDESCKICKFGVCILLEHRVLREIDGNVGIEVRVECDTESDFRTRLDGNAVGEKKLSDEGIELRIALVKEGRYPFADRPGRVALVGADTERTLDLCINTGDRDIAVVVEERNAFIHVFVFTCDVLSHRLRRFAVTHDLDRLNCTAADGKFERIERCSVCTLDRRADIDFRTCDLLTFVGIDINADSYGFVVEFVFDVCPSNLRPSRDIACVNADDLIHDIRQAFCNLQLDVVGRKRCDDVKRKRSSRIGIVHARCRRNQRLCRCRAVDGNGGVFDEQRENDLVEIDFGLNLAESEVACVKIEYAGGIVNSEQDFAVLSEFLAREFDEQLAVIVFGVDLRLFEEQILQNRRKIELSRNTQLVIDVHFGVECESRFGYILFFKVSV